MGEVFSCFGPRDLPDDPGLTGENLWTPLIREQTKIMMRTTEQEVRKTSDSEWEKLLANSVAMEEWMGSLDKLSMDEEKKFAKKNSAWYKALWKKYDANKDGELSIEECRLMTRDALNNEKAMCPETTKQLMIAEMKIMLAAIRHTDLPSQTIKDLEMKMFKEVQENLDFANAEAAAKYDEAIARSDEIADELWQKMDHNNDGKVTRKEFLSYYVEASNNTIRFIDVVRVTGNETHYQSLVYG